MLYVNMQSRKVTALPRLISWRSASARTLTEPKLPYHQLNIHALKTVKMSSNMSGPGHKQLKEEIKLKRHL